MYYIYGVHVHVRNSKITLCLSLLHRTELIVGVLDWWKMLYMYMYMWDLWKRRLLGHNNRWCSGLVEDVVYVVHVYVHVYVGSGSSPHSPCRY